MDFIFSRLVYVNRSEVLVKVERHPVGDGLNQFSRSAVLAVGVHVSREPVGFLRNSPYGDAVLYYRNEVLRTYRQ